jgi:alpha-L-rhamnosidase
LIFPPIEPKMTVRTPSNMIKKTAAAAAVLVVWTAMLESQVNPDLLAKGWPARWITVPNAQPFAYGVYHFRKTFDVPAVPSRFLVHVTGDNRYQLFVNGRRVVWGPARGDLNHWRFETIDLAPHLKAGRNVLAAVVWNFAQFAPEAQISNQTGFLLQGDAAAERVADTNATWKAIPNDAYTPRPVTYATVGGYYAAGPGEQLDAGRYPWRWEQPDFDDAAWGAAQAIGPGAPRDARDGPNRWMLVPRTIPLMEETPERFTAVREATNVSVPAAFPAQPAAVTVAAHTRARLLIDRSHLTTGYPELTVSGGTGATVRLTYAEALIGPDGRTKGNRNEVAGKTMRGYSDVFVADGGGRRLYRPLWWRTYRYVELAIETAADPITIDDLRSVYTGYPFQMKARLEAGSPRLDTILEVGWRTARVNAHETYMDCPYYEQLQYVGDTRIQALVSLYNDGDARLMRNAIALVNDSRTAEGATMSRAPTRQQQYIPPFSLWWIGMVHDYWWYRDDHAFVREMLPGVRAVLAFFARHQRAGGSLGAMPWWNFVDWSWPNGVPPAEPGESSAAHDLQLLLALDWAADLEGALGTRSIADAYRVSANTLRATIRTRYWDGTRGLFADTPRKQAFSQQANALAVLARVVEGPEARALVNRVLTDASLTPCTYYFRHYLHTAVNQVGEGDRYLDLLGEWDAMLERGLTTWAEKPEPTRSDAHAWSASPNFELFRTLLGIDSAAPGFSRVVVRPYLGSLTQASGSIPHPKGEIAVKLARRGDAIDAEVSLPQGVTGEFVWGEYRTPLPAGQSRVRSKK